MCAVDSFITQIFGAPIFTFPTITFTARNHGIEIVLWSLCRPVFNIAGLGRHLSSDGPAFLTTDFLQGFHCPAFSKLLFREFADLFVLYRAEMRFHHFDHGRVCAQQCCRNFANSMPIRATSRSQAAFFGHCGRLNRASCIHPITLTVPPPVRDEGSAPVAPSQERYSWRIKRLFALFRLNSDFAFCQPDSPLP